MKLDAKYSRKEFLNFVESFIDGFGLDIRTAAFKSSLFEGLTYLGQSAHLELSVFEVSMTNPSSRRLTITSEAFKILREFGVYKALIVFKEESTETWRLSLLTASPTIENGKAVVKLSNPRRHSYVLGRGAKIATPMKYLLGSERCTSFSMVQRAFSAEVVNIEFYTAIARLYDQLLAWSVESAEALEQLTPEFGVRLIGRLIFCWFLREKRSDAGVPLIGEDLVSVAAVHVRDYYSCVLEPLFFEVLSTPIEERKTTAKSRSYDLVPYLNGGLFSHQPDDKYGQRPNDNAKLFVPDQWLRDLFEVLETYHFTVDENTSTDIDLSIDPEMLGRIFENLLARINPETGETVRKQTGSFYTPREIVDFMVAESLASYLEDTTGINREKIENLVSHDLNDDDLNPLSRDEKSLIINRLLKIKVLDPACGSGAFPMGILQRVMFIFHQADPDAELWLEHQTRLLPRELRDMFLAEVKEKNFEYLQKHGIVRDSIFGVDIQPIATEISRLRCFLTLIVDQKVRDSEQNRGLHPLPNLDFKFVTANSLMGIGGTFSRAGVGGTTLFEDASGIEALSDIRADLFGSSAAAKSHLKTEFVLAQNSMLKNLFSFGLNDVARVTKNLAIWNPFSLESTTWFDSFWMFGQGDGFDLVIGNPPYVKKEHLSADQVNELEAEFSEPKVGPRGEVGQPKPWSDDLYVHFIFKAFEFVKAGGVVCFITNDSFVGLASKRRVRRLLMSQDLIEVANCPSETFNATIYTAIFLAKKQAPERETFLGTGFSYPGFEVLPSNKVSREYVRALPDERFVTREDTIVSRLLKFPRCKTFLSIRDTGIHSGNVRTKLFFEHPTEDATHKMLQGKQIVRWAINWNAPSAKFKYCNPKYKALSTPGIGRGGKISSKAEYWHFCGDETNHFQPERILIRQTGDGVFAAYQNNREDGQFYTDNTLFSAFVKTEGNLKYYLGILNSRILNYVYQYLSAEAGKTLAQVKTGLLEELPMIYDPELEKLIVPIVTKMIEARRSNSEADVSAFDKELDLLVADLFELSDDERRRVGIDFSPFS